MNARNVFSLDLNVPSKSLSVTVLGREFQVARLANAVLANGLDSRVVVVEHRVCMLSHRVCSLVSIGIQRLDG